MYDFSFKPFQLIHFSEKVGSYTRSRVLQKHEDLTRSRFSFLTLNSLHETTTKRTLRMSHFENLSATIFFSYFLLSLFDFYFFPVFLFFRSVNVAINGSSTIILRLLINLSSHYFRIKLDTIPLFRN